MPELFKLIQLVQIAIHHVPVEIYIFMDHDISKSSQRRQGPGKISRQYPKFSHSQYRLIII